MASQQNSSSNASESHVAAQERVQAWLYRMYFTEFHSSTAVRRVLPLSQEEFQLRYFAREVVPAEPEAVAASGPAESSLSSEGGAGGLPAFATMLRSAMNFLLPGRRASAASSEPASTDTSSSDATTFSWGCRSPRQPRSLLVLTPASSEAGETGETSSGSGAEVSSSPSESDMRSYATAPDWTPAPPASGDEASDLDSEAQFIVAGVNNITRSHRERMRDLRDQFESSSSEPASSPTTPEPKPAPLSAQAITDILAQVDQDFARANQMPYDFARMTNSRGEYRAELARIEALNRERLATVDREYRRLRGVWCEQASMSNSRGEYVAEMAEIEALDRAHFSSTT